MIRQVHVEVVGCVVRGVVGCEQFFFYCLIVFYGVAFGGGSGVEGDVLLFLFHVVGVAEAESGRDGGEEEIEIEEGDEEEFEYGFCHNSILGGRWGVGSGLGSEGRRNLAVITFNEAGTIVKYMQYGFRPGPFFQRNRKTRTTTRYRIDFRFARRSSSII